MDLCIIDGHGIAHPRQLGITTHMGLQTSTVKKLRNLFKIVLTSNRELR